VVAKSARIQGVVVVRVLVNGTGTPVKACAVSGPVPLRPAAEDAALRFRFVPLLVNGKAVRFMVHKLTFNFKISDETAGQQ